LRARGPHASSPSRSRRKPWKSAVTRTGTCSCDGDVGGEGLKAFVRGSARRRWSTSPRERPPSSTVGLKHPSQDVGSRCREQPSGLRHGPREIGRRRRRSRPARSSRTAPRFDQAQRSRHDVDDTTRSRRRCSRQHVEAEGREGAARCQASPLAV